MSQASRRRRSNDGLRAFAAWLTDRGYPVEGVSLAGWQGKDIQLDGYSIEHKAADEWRPYQWLKEARTRPGRPMALYQGRGQAEASVGEWLIIMRAGDVFPPLG